MCNRFLFLYLIRSHSMLVKSTANKITHSYQCHSEFLVDMSSKEQGLGACKIFFLQAAPAPTSAPPPATALTIILVKLKTKIPTNYLCRTIRNVNPFLKIP